MNTQLRLRDDARLDVHYRDDTPYGSAVTGLCDRLLYHASKEVLAALTQLPPSERSTRAFTWLVDDGPLGALYSGPDTLRDAVLHPAFDAVSPVALRVVPFPGAPARMLPLPATGDLAAWIGAWSSPAPAPRTPSARGLFDALAEAGAMTSAPRTETVLRDGVTMVGHATVAIQRDGARILIDPYLLPPSLSARTYRPLSAAEVAPDAVFITHSHPDHYDLGTLLRFGPDTPIFVPAVPRESLLSIDMRARLVELGFRRVREVAWGTEVHVGPLRVRVCPFYGEQPTDADFLHPQARNLGNTYVVDDGARRLAFVADAGRDGAGDCLDMAAALREDFGPVDAVFGGYRAWRLCPDQLLPSSVARYALQVPRHHWGRSMQLMNDADDLLELGARWGAERVVPYANGGAPWFWEAGLGPRLDGRDGDELADFDPDLRPLAAAGARRRAEGRSTPAVTVMHPGAHLSWTASDEDVVLGVVGEAQAWPFTDPSHLFAA